MTSLSQLASQLLRPGTKPRQTFEAGLRRWRRWRYRLTPARRDPHLVLFVAFSGRSYAGSPRALYEHLLGDARRPHLRFVWALRDPVRAKEKFPALCDPRTTIVRYGTREYFRAYLRARVWVASTIVPDYAVPAHDQLYVQTWHGTPFKRLGPGMTSDVVDARTARAVVRFRQDGTKMSLLLSSSAYATRTFASAFSLDQTRREHIVVPTGNPRNDVLARAGVTDYDEQAVIQRAARERAGLPQGKRVVLYAPAWRDDQQAADSSIRFTPELDFDALQRALGPDTVIAFRVHYRVVHTFDFAAHEGFVYDVSGVDEVTDLYLAADVLVTDYSSAFFDYALLRRPIVFYMPDLERYSTELGGFYLGLNELPGPVLLTTGEVIDALTNPQVEPGRETFLERFATFDDGAASLRVVERVLPT